MNLDDAQKAKVKAWIETGLQPPEIQKRLGDEFGLRLTYMEVRFLLADLGLQPKDKEPPAPPPVFEKSKAAPGRAQAGRPGAVGRGGEDVAAARVSLSVDQLTRSGAMVSGKVTFSDGKSAEWYLDQMGRLGVAPKDKGYKPTQADLMEFQEALQDELAKLGY